MLTKFVSSFAALGVVFALCSSAAFAGVTDDGLTYEIDDGSVTITGSTWTAQNAPEHLEIPAEIEGLPVRVIGDVAFQFAQSKSVHIPNTITDIGERAFSNSKIKSLIIPGTVKRIGSLAFVSCHALDDLTIEHGVEIIGGSAFASTSIKTVVIPGSVTLIDQFAFYTCEKLETVEIHEGVIAIGERAFAQTAVQSLHVPASVSSLGSGLYYRTLYSLEITIAQESPYFTAEEGVVYTKNLDKIIAVPSSKAGHFDVPASVTEISSRAFWFCEGITGVSLPTGLQKIGASAFSGCINLTSIDIPEGVTVIESWTFNNCESLTTVTFRGPVTSIGAGAFYWSDITELLLPSTVTEIGDEAFYMANMTSLILPNDLISLGHSAFWGCPITSITLPDGLVSVGSYAFYNNKATVLNIPDSVTSMGMAAFSSTTLSEVHVGKGVTHVERDMFFINFSNGQDIYFYGLIPTFEEDSFPLYNPRRGARINIFYMEGSGDWPATIHGHPTFTFSPEVLQVEAAEAFSVSFFARFRTYKLETSSDLLNWTTLEVIEGEGGPVERSYTTNESGAPVFFRLVSL